MEGLNAHYSWAFNDQVEDHLELMPGTMPARWGRMTPLSRVMVVEVGKILRNNGLLQPDERCCDLGMEVGLIGGTKKGCLYTDMDFIRSMDQGVGLASPALFGYTLPNIPLAEAASHFGLVGPVYALFDETHPLEAAEQEAHRILQIEDGLSFMLACEFDHFRSKVEREVLIVNLTLLKKDDDCNSCLS